MSLIVFLLVETSATEGNYTKKCLHFFYPVHFDSKHENAHQSPKLRF